MTILILFYIIFYSVASEELAITKAYTDYLKKHVTWEVIDYEDNIFRGWTINEVKAILGLNLDTIAKSEIINNFKGESENPNLPSSINWMKSECDHGVLNQGNCGSCWAVATAGMLSDRACLNNHDHGWLSVQELVSCDKQDHGCGGGWPAFAVIYVMANGGLVPANCYPYIAKDEPCPLSCKDGSDWEKVHYGDCPEGPTYCKNVGSIKSCLQTGPITAGFYVCQSFLAYKNGYYQCDCEESESLGLHGVNLMGYGTNSNLLCYFFARNSWGPNWGDKGYFKILCETCGIDGQYPKGNVACMNVAP